MNSLSIKSIAFTNKTKKNLWISDQFSYLLRLCTVKGSEQIFFNFSLTGIQNRWIIKRLEFPVSLWIKTRYIYIYISICICAQKLKCLLFVNCPLFRFCLTHVKYILLLNLFFIELIKTISFYDLFRLDWSKPISLFLFFWVFHFNSNCSKFDYSLVTRFLR